MSANASIKMSLLTLTFAMTALAQQPTVDPSWTLLWPGGAPGVLGEEDMGVPRE